ncbi:MAG: hypothetical protein NPIRA03_07790 [Nitrospirales bacterium]|nr:MAG: hypothetical protein NPIRA03_07790 [Nitrospirales bacterium]
MIMSPTNASAHTTTPITIKVHAAHHAAKAMQVWLDGVDITSRFMPTDRKGVHRAEVDRPVVNWGKNQIVVTSGAHRKRSHFFLDEYQSGSPAAANLPRLIPIETRVVTGSGDQATDYHIALYKDPDDPTAATLIPAPTPKDGSNVGFQVVYLKRSDLSVVSNVSVGKPSSKTPFSDSPLYHALVDTPADCGSVGCIRLIQSLETIGFTPCYHSNDKNTDCSDFTTLLKNDLGLSSRLAYVNGDEAHIAFSSISNTTPSTNTNNFPAGTFFESLTCSGSNWDSGPACDSLGNPNTSHTAPTGATPSQLGKIAGVLILDNHHNFTFAQNAPLVSFSTSTIGMGTDVTNTITVDGKPYVSGPLYPSQGGFHLLIVNSKNLAVVQHQTFPSKGDASEIEALSKAIDLHKSYGYLFFIAGFGYTNYNCQPGTSGPCGARGNWYQASQVMADLGGTQQVFYLANNPNSDPYQYDDYTLVGSFMDGMKGGTDTGLHQIGAEMSSVISRETEAFPPPTGQGQGADMEGFLHMNHQGFYSPASFGHRLNLSKTTIADILSASLLNPTPWPFPGPDAKGSKAAYDWISRQLCCLDIRSAYVNLNISPAIWLADLRHLAYDPSSIPNSSQADFNAMVQQLTTEFQYVTLARLFQRNVVGLYQDQQANVSLLLQDDGDKILKNLQVGLTTPAHAASWTGILNDVFSIGSSLLNAIPGGGIVTAGTEVALTVGTAIASQAASHTNSPAGTPLQAQENQEIAAGNLANQLANQFSATLISLGSEFDRVVTDWGRLKTLAGPLLADQVPWDNNATGLLLQSYDRAVQRELYVQLLPTNFVVQHLPYTGHDLHVQKTSDGSDYICDWEHFANNKAVLYYPNGRINDDHHDADAGKYPKHFQWGIWALTLAKQQNEGCPGNKGNYPNTYDYPDTFGLFQPLDPGNPDALGAYRFWFYTRGSFQTIENNHNQPCYDASC